MTDCNFALASAIFAVIAHKPVLNQRLVMVRLGVKFKYIAGFFFTCIFKAACALYPFFRKAIFIIYVYARRISVSPVCFGNIARISVENNIAFINSHLCGNGSKACHKQIRQKGHPQDKSDNSSFHFTVLFYLRRKSLALTVIPSAV